MPLDRPVSRLAPHLLRLRRQLAVGLLLVALQPARADDDDCSAPPQAWQPRSAVTALAQRNGWQVERLKIDDGCYEVRGTDALGRTFKARIDPETLKVLKLKQEDHQRDRDRDRDRKAE